MWIKVTKEADLKAIEARLESLKEMLTQPDLESKINHYDRTILLEEVEELESLRNNSGCAICLI